MRQPEHLKKILKAVKKTVKIPVTLKIRSGWDEGSQNAVYIAKVAEDCGISMIAIHGRTRKQLYRGEANWDIVSEISKAVSIPVVGSGDVEDGKRAREGLMEGASGIMIGRGALKNPWVFSKVKAEVSSEHYEEPAQSEIIRVIRKYMKILMEELPEKAVMGKLKQFSSQAVRMIPGSSQIRKSLCLSQSVEQFNDVLDAWDSVLSRDDSPVAKRAESFGGA